MQKIKTQVGIIGAGPAGLTLAHWLKSEGIDSVILERRSRQYVEERVRAGLLEQNTVDVLSQLGQADRLHREGQIHSGVYLNFDGCKIRIPFEEHTVGRKITIYGQKEIIKDLTASWLNAGEALFFHCQAQKIEDVDSNKPSILYDSKEGRGRIECDFVAACDGFHGIGRSSIPRNSYREYTRTYPFSWLGILAEVAPSTDELIYAYHANGFALHSMRNERISRLYIQVDNDDALDEWEDARIWDELSVRLGSGDWKLKTGPIIEKSITSMRSFMIDRMQHGRLFIAGDAAHIVPPTGAKGLNLAVADVRRLAMGLTKYYQDRSMDELDNYTEKCLKRVWRVQEFSDYMTRLMHKQYAHGSFKYQLQKSRFDYLKISPSAVRSIAENYVGLPFESV